MLWLIPLGVAALILLVPLIYVLVIYNRLVSLRQHVAESWSGIDVELKRRYELIPNLVATVKGYAAHEREVLEKVIALRNAAEASRGGASSQGRDETALMLGVKQLFALVERYPQIKADAHFLELQRELALTEDRIAAARRFYNANTREMRQLCETIPSSLVAGMFSFRAGEYFELDSEAERVTPRVGMEC
ncbi:MAG: LemA family protein [Phycisphaerales bacterium]|nr:LemA family protein [Phycisphaerales bacterium]